MGGAADLGQQRRLYSPAFWRYYREGRGLMAHDLVGARVLVATTVATLLAGYGHADECADKRQRIANARARMQGSERSADYQEFINAVRAGGDCIPPLQQQAMGGEMSRAASNAAKYSMMEKDAESRRLQEEAEKHNRQVFEGQADAQQQEKKDWLAVPKETLEREANEPPPELPDPKKEAKRRQIAWLYCAFAGERAKNMAAIQELRGNLRMGGAVDMRDVKDYTDRT